jgi:tetratricopeptide (TPR) repeat protein
VQLFKLLGVLPPLVHGDPDEGLMIAFGAGMSSGAAIQRVNSLEVVDLNPDIQGPAELFRRENLNVIDSPKLKVTANDGRNELLLDPKRYSVIISDATNPKMFDSWTLYTKEFYELTRDRLLPGGVFAQWMVYPLPADSLSLILRTFRTVYPHMSFWCIHGSTQCLMLGTEERLNIDYTEFDRRLAPVLEESRFVDYGVATTPKFLSFLLLGEDELGEFLGDSTKISTDDLPYAQFEVGQEQAGAQECLDALKVQNTIAPYLTNLGPEADRILARLEAHRAISQRLNFGFFLGRRDEYLKAAHLAARAGIPGDANVATALRYDADRKAHHLRWAATHPDSANVYNALGYVYWHEGDHERAIESLTKAISLAPDFGNAHANLARVYLDSGRLDEAEAKLLEVRRLNPASETLRLVDNGLTAVYLLRRMEYEGPSVALYRALAGAYMGIGDMLGALQAIGRAEVLAAGDGRTLAELALFYERLELVDDAAAAYRRASEAMPGDPALEEAALRAGYLQQNPLQLQAWLHERHSANLATDTSAEHPETCTEAMEVWGRHDFLDSVSHEQLVEAAALFERSVRTDPNHLHAYLDAAMLYELAQDYDRALGVWRRASKIGGGPPQAAENIRRLELLSELQWGRLQGEQITQALGELGSLCQALGRTAAAIEAYEGALLNNPSNTELRFRLATVYAAAGRYPRAEEALVLASAGNPDGELGDAVRDGLTRVREILARD